MVEEMQKLARAIKSRKPERILEILKAYKAGHGKGFVDLVKVEDLADYIESEILLEGTSIKSVDKSLTIGSLMGVPLEGGPRGSSLGKPQGRVEPGLKLTVGDLTKERR